MSSKRSYWASIAAVILSLGLGYVAGVLADTNPIVQSVQEPALRKPGLERVEAPPLPPAVAEWGDEVEPGVHILSRDAPSRTDADADLRTRLTRFIEPPVVVAAREYAPEGQDWPKGPRDVYLVANRTDMQYELHAIYWYGPADDPDGTAWHRRFVLGTGASHGLLLVDVDDDGREEAITTVPGANVWTVAIIDPFAEEAIHQDRGLPATQSAWWKFADLDDDGLFEAITAGPAHDVASTWRDETQRQQVFAVYSLTNGEWSLSGVHDDDPTLRR